jgi:diaminopimelate epimerase
MRIPFTKMQGLGNDFVIARADGQSPPGAERIRLLADRRRGIGFDQLLWLEPPRDAANAVRYRIFNADGGEAEQCGNGARCIASFMTRGRPGDLSLEHAGGTSSARVEADGSVTVAMNVPDFEPGRVPFRAASPASRYAMQVGDEQVEVGVVSLGNPHAVLQVAAVDAAPVARFGPALEGHERFPNRANIGFMQVVDRSHIRLRVYERGAGETQACGTGACAAVVIGRTWQLLDAAVTVQLPGGELRIRWEGAGQPVWMTGEAVTVFEGTIDA